MATRDSYTKQEWENLPAETTPITAERLEHIEQGIKDAADKRALKEIYDDIAISLGRNQSTNKGNYSIAVGPSATASEMYSRAYGPFTTAYGLGSLAEGMSTTASGQYSIAEGMYTIAIGDYQHVFGKWNMEDGESKYVIIVGGGNDDKQERKNIHTIDWVGNGWFAGDVTNGAGISLNSLKSTVDNLETIAGGGSIAKVFDTKEDLDTWLAVDGNPDTLSVGQNIYIAATGTPDYWWDGTGLQVLETDKVVIESMTYDETMAILNETAEEVA